MASNPAVWFLAIRTGTGTDVFTRTLCEGLVSLGVRAEITWLPHRAEYLPWSVAIPSPPDWATVVHVNTWLHSRFIPKHLAVVSTMHLCVHDVSLLVYKSFFQKIYHRFWVRLLEQKVLKRSQVTTAVSDYTSSVTQQIFGKKDIKVIHNGVEIPNLESLGGADPKRGGKFRLLYVGNWSVRKGVDLLGPIMSDLGERFELLYTSDARGGDKEYNLPNNCICLGRLNKEQLQQVYVNADVLIFPSRLEGLPLVVMESMANGLPVVALNRSSLSELVEDGVTGFLCQTEERSEFVRLISEMFSNPVLRQTMSKLSRKKAEEKFGAMRMCKEYASIYLDLDVERSLD